MLFNSLNFCFFFIAVFVLYWTINGRLRWLLLLAASYVFYSFWEPFFLLLIVFSTLVDYFTCRFLTSSPIKQKKKIGLGVSLVTNLSLLFSFKYFDFFHSIVNGSSFSVIDQATSIDSKMLLPVGISFYTFQTLSYSIDVYRSKILPEKHLGKFALFVSFFPQLIAGPIERANSLLPQLKAKNIRLNIEDIKEGVLLFTWGLFKKVVVADNIKILADHIFDHSQFQNGGGVLFGLFAFTIQIYADFSGYSDMAVGTSKMLGIDLKMNFRTPYFSQSITEFWRRWHITLSLWLKDYVFIPLGGSKMTYFLTLRNLFITFFLAGVWHGASWNFVIWGCLHGLLVLIDRLFGWHKKHKNNVFSIFRVVFTFGIVTLTMLPVRADNLTHLNQLVSLLLTMNFHDTYIAFAENVFTPGALGLLILFSTDLFFAKESIVEINKRKGVVKYIWFLIILLLILFIGDSTSEAFFYFQF